MCGPVDLSSKDPNEPPLRSLGTQTGFSWGLHRMLVKLKGCQSGDIRGVWTTVGINEVCNATVVSFEPGLHAVNLQISHERLSTRARTESRDNTKTVGRVSHRAPLA